MKMVIHKIKSKNIRKTIIDILHLINQELNKRDKLIN